MPRLSVPSLTSTHVAFTRPDLSNNTRSMNTSSFNSQALNSGIHLTTTSTLSAPRVSATLASRVPPSATPSNPDTLWIQTSPGQFVPVINDNLPSTSGLHYQSANFVDDHSSLPDNNNLAQDNAPVIPTSISDEHTAGIAESLAESDAESYIEADHYLASINKIYEFMFQTLGEDFCPRPAALSTSSTISVTEQ